MQDVANAKLSYTGAAPSILESMLKILTLGAVDMLGAVAPGAVVFGLLAPESKVVVFRVGGVETACVTTDTSGIAVFFFVSFGVIVFLAPLLEMDSTLLDATVEKGNLEELERDDDVVLDISALRRWFVNMLGLNVALADLDATALKSVVDLLVPTFVVGTTRACLAWLEAVVTGRELVCGELKLKFCLCVWEAGFRSAGAESDRLLLGCCPLPLLSEA